MALVLTIGGVDFTSTLDFKSVAIQDTVESKGDTFNFNLNIYDGVPAVPLEGGEVIFTDGGTREFAGVLVATSRTMGEGNRLTKYACQCRDYTFLFDRRFVNAIYIEQRADLTVIDILNDLQTDANNDQGGGDVHYTDFQSDVTQLQTAAVIPEQRFEYMLPSQAMDILAESAGMQWHINFAKQVVLEFVGDPVAPLDIEAFHALPTLLIDTDIVNFKDARVDVSIETVGTKAILRDAIIKSTSDITDSFTWHTGDSLKFILTRRPFSLAHITTVEINSVTMTLKLDDIDRDADDETIEANTVFIYIGPRGSNDSYIRVPTANAGPGLTLEDGELITAAYAYDTTDDHEDPDILAREDIANRTGGDGIHEFVFSKISNLAVVNREDLDVIGDIILTRKSLIHITGRFVSRTKGWKAGQIFDLVWAKENINTAVYVISTRKIVLTPAGTPIVETTVDFSNIPRGARL